MMRLLKLSLVLVLLIGITGVYFTLSTPTHLFRFSGSFKDCPARPSCVSSVATDADHAIAPLTFEGDRLELNLDGSAGGWLKIEVQDAQGRALPGFGLADAVCGNSTAKGVTWRGSSDLADIAGRPVTLRFVMRDIKLYAFQFVRGQAA